MVSPCPAWEESPKVSQPAELTLYTTYHVLTRLCAVASHLSSLPALQFSNFPYASSTPESTSFANIPEFVDYGPAMDALFKATVNSDGSVKLEDEAMFKSASSAMSLAVRSDSSGIDSM